MKLKLLLMVPLSFLIYACSCEVYEPDSYYDGVLEFDNASRGIFVNVPKNSDSIKVFTIKNVGSSDVSIRSITTAYSRYDYSQSYYSDSSDYSSYSSYPSYPNYLKYFFIDKTTCGNILPQNASCDIYVKFRPTEDIETMSNLYIGYGAYRSIEIPLYGTTSVQILLPQNNISGITPSQRVDFALAGGSKYIYLFGGRNFDIYDNTFYRLSDNNSWQYIPKVATTPTGRAGHTLTYVDNSSLYMIGGVNINGVVNGTLKYSFIDNVWSTLANMTTSRVYHTATYDNTTNAIYIFGGTDGTILLNSIEKYDIATDAWSTLTPTGTTPTPIKLHSAVKIGSKIFVFGGVGADNKATSTLLSYDITANQWDNLTISESVIQPIARYGHSASVYKDIMYIVGGLVDNNSTISSLEYDNAIYLYDSARKVWDILKPINSISKDSSTINLGKNVYILHINTPMNIFKFFNDDNATE